MDLQFQAHLYCFPPPLCSGDVPPPHSFLPKPTFHTLVFRSGTGPGQALLRPVDHVSSEGMDTRVDPRTTSPKIANASLGTF